MPRKVQGSSQSRVHTRKSAVGQSSTDRLLNPSCNLSYLAFSSLRSLQLSSGGQLKCPGALSSLVGQCLNSRQLFVYFVYFAVKIFAFFPVSAGIPGSPRPKFYGCLV